MQHDPSNEPPEREVIELPEEPARDHRPSPLNQALLWITLLALGGSATYVMYFRGVPQASGAAPAGNLSPMLPGDSGRLADFLSPDRDPLRVMRAALSDSGGIFQRLLADSTPRQIPLAELQCNPFRQPASASTGQAAPTTAPSPQQQEAQRAAMLQAVEAMQLQSINAAGSHRSCMINDVLYIEGGIINGFTIEQINSQSVVIRNGLYHFELTMNR